MSLKSFWNWLTSGGNSPTPTPSTPSYRELADRSDIRAKAMNIDPPRLGRKTYNERYVETDAMSTDEINKMIAQRKAEGKGDQCGVAYRVLADREKSGGSGNYNATTPTGLTHGELADRSDVRAKALNIDPPRPGRKTYNERYTESSGLSKSAIESKIAERKAQGKETGVLERILHDRGK